LREWGFGLGGKPMKKKGQVVHRRAKKGVLKKKR